MKLGNRICLFVLVGVALLMGCVPQKMQLRGTWEFVGYKDERVQSIFEIDNTICFDGDGNGLYECVM